LWRRLIRVGLRCPLDLCRYLLVPRDCVCKVLFQPSRCRFSPQHSGACRRCTMIGRGSPFQSPHPERILNIRNTRWAVSVHSPAPALSDRHGVLSSPAPTRGAGSSSRTWKHAAGHLDLGPDAPPGNEGARERRIREIDRDRVVQDPPYSRGRQRPAIRAAILVEPGGDLSMAPAETSGWNRKPDADGKVRPAVVIISRGLPGICEFLVCSNPRIAHRVRSV